MVWRLLLPVKSPTFAEKCGGARPLEGVENFARMALTKGFVSRTHLTNLNGWAVFWISQGAERRAFGGSWTRHDLGLNRRSLQGSNGPGLRQEHVRHRSPKRGWPHHHHQATQHRVRNLGGGARHRIDNRNTKPKVCPAGIIMDGLTIFIGPLHLTPFHDGI